MRVVASLACLSISLPALAQSIPYSFDPDMIALSERNDRPALVVQSSHSEQIYSVTYSRDGRFLASGGDREVKLWDAETGQLLRDLPTESLVDMLAFSPDGAYLYAKVSSIVRWNLQNGRRESGKRHCKTPMAWLKGGAAVACVQSGSNGTLELGAPMTSDGVTSLPLGWEISSLASDGANLIAVGFNGGQVVLVEIDGDRMTKKATLATSGTRVNAVAIVNGRVIAGRVYGGLTAWDAASGKLVWDVQTPGMYDLVGSPDGKEVAATMGKGGGVDLSMFGGSSSAKTTVQTYDVATGKNTRGAATEDDAHDAAWSDRGLAVTSGPFLKVRTLSIFDAKRLTRIRKVESEADAPTQARFTPGGLVNGTHTGTVRAWDLKGVAPPQAVHLDSPGCLDSDGVNVAVGDKKGIVHVLDAMTLAEKKQLAGLAGQPFNVATRSGVVLASGLMADHGVFRWGSGESSPAHLVEPDDSYRFALTADGATSAITARGGSIRIFDGATQRFEIPGQTFGSAHALAFSKDESTLALGTIGAGDGKFLLVLYDLPNRREIRRVVAHSSYLLDIVFHPNGKTIATAGADGVVKLWDLQTLTLQKKIVGHTEGVESVSFNADGSLIATAGRDHKLKLWRAATGELLCDLVGMKDDWIVIAPDGRFDGSPAALKKVQWVQGNTAVPVESFFDRFYTPHLLASLVGAGEKPQAPAQTFTKPIHLPPHVSFVTAPGAVKDETVEVEIAVKDQGGGVKDVSLFHNGKLVSGLTRGVQKKAQAGERRTFTVTLLPGDNELRAVATNDDGTESTPALIVMTYEAKAKTQPDLFVIVVGLNAYKNETMNLNYGKGDAESFAAEVALRTKKLFRKIEVVKLFDAQVTRAAVKAAFDKTAKTAGADDMFVFYYAGHGVMSEETPARFYLVPHDVTKLFGADDMLREKAIAADELKAWAADIPARKQVMVLDACQSGGALQAFAQRGASEQKAMYQLARSAGIAVLAATGTEQFASEFKALKHGIFTYALLKGLSGDADGGKDGTVTVRELDAFLNDAVPELTKQHRGSAQFPNSFVVGQDFPLVLTK